MASINPTFRKLRSVAEKIIALDPTSSDFALRLKIVQDHARTALAEEGGDRRGNPRLEDARQVAIHVRRERQAAFRATILPHIEKLRGQGARTYEQLANGLNDLGIKPPRSERWTAGQVYVIEHPRNQKSE